MTDQTQATPDNTPEAVSDKTAKLMQDGLVPLLPLRDVVVYPHLVIPLFVGRAKSVKALEIASNSNKQILLVAQKSANKDEPDAEDLYDIGTMATVLQMLKLPDGTVKVLVEGTQRVRVSGFIETEDCFLAKADLIVAADQTDAETEALMRTVLTQFDQYVKLNKKNPT